MITNHVERFLFSELYRILMPQLAMVTHKLDGKASTFCFILSARQLLIIRSGIRIHAVVFLLLSQLTYAYKHCRRTSLPRLDDGRLNPGKARYQTSNVSSSNHANSNSSRLCIKPLWYRLRTRLPSGGNESYCPSQLDRLRCHQIHLFSFASITAPSGWAMH